MLFRSYPQLAALNLMDAAQRRGTVLRLRTRVVGVAIGGGRVTGVELADGSTIDAPVVVNAAGPWSSALNRLAGVTDGMDRRMIIHAIDRSPGGPAHPVPAPMRTSRDGHVISPKVTNTVSVHFTARIKVDIGQPLDLAESVVSHPAVTAQPGQCGLRNNPAAAFAAIRQRHLVSPLPQGECRFQSGRAGTDHQHPT